MFTFVRISLALFVVFAPSALVQGADQKSSPVKLQSFDGKVVPLKELLEKSGAKLDKEAEPHWLALVAGDGKVYPLVEDAGARMFFKDKALLNRRMHLTGRLLQDSHMLQVLGVNSWVKGELHDIYYWCDVCSIRRNEKLRQCDCCGGQLELREVPLKK